MPRCIAKFELFLAILFLSAGSVSAEGLPTGLPDISSLRPRTVCSREIPRENYLKYFTDEKGRWMIEIFGRDGKDAMIVYTDNVKRRKQYYLAGGAGWLSLSGLTRRQEEDLIRQNFTVSEMRFKSLCSP